MFDFQNVTFLPLCLEGDCDFEKGLCTWSHVKGLDKFDWLLGKGSTQSQFTGPKSDHSKGDLSGNLAADALPSVTGKPSLAVCDLK